MGRLSLIVILVNFSVLHLTAQSGGYSNLEFVENKGQWGSLVKFRAEMTAGHFVLHKDGFTVIQHDTADLRRVQYRLHMGNSIHTGNRNVTATASSTRVTKSGAVPVEGKAPPGDGGGQGGGTGSGSSGVPGSTFDPDMIIHSHSYRVSFEHANEQVEILPEKSLPTYLNYFTGKDPSQWKSQCKKYQGVVYRNIYPGIDLHYYSDKGFLKYDLIVHPGSDPGQISIRYDGQEKLSIKKKEVLIKTSVGTVKEMAPRSYQLDTKEKRDVECDYYLSGNNTIRFRIKNYSSDATLVIDPTEVFCSFTGSKSDNWGYTSTYDGSGNFYAGGIALDYPNFSGNNFYTSPGAFQNGYRGGDGSEGNTQDNNGNIIPYDYDIAIMKFNSSGTTALYATYLGGGGDEQPHSMVCDAQGNLVVTGRTSSADFPVFPAGTATYGNGGNFDLFLTKFNANGTGLIGSRRIGGSGSDGVNFKPKYNTRGSLGTQQLRLNYGDDGRSEVILDGANNIYLAACTQSADFPVTPGAFQTVYGGTQDGVLIKTSPDVSTILFSSYIGGSGADAAFVLALSPLTNDIYVAGGTMSTDLKGTGQGTVIQPSNLGGVDGFVSLISNNGANLIKTTYFGTAGTDIVYGIDVDNKGFPYIMGTTTGLIPAVNSPFNQGQGSSQANGKQFITKLKQDLSGIVYSANFGPGGKPYPNLSPTAFLVDRCENVYVSGWGGGINISEDYNNSTTNGLTPTSGAIKGGTDGDDFYFFVLQRDAASQLYGSFFGQQNGNLGDHVDGGTSRFDKQGVIYQSICANCYGGAAFPTTPGVWAITNGTGSDGCNEAAVKIAFNFAGVAAGLKAGLKGRGDSLGCVPLTATLQDTIRNAKLYIWDYGDLSKKDTTTNYSVTHVYNLVGTYLVTLVAIDSSSCNVADTVYMHITARNDPSVLAFTYAKILPCTSLDYDFNNQSTYPGNKVFTDTSFAWDFGDNSGLVKAGLGIKNHAFPSPGPYTVKLILADSSYCNYPDTLAKSLNIAQNVKAQFVTPSSGCAPYTAVFNNTSIAGQQYYWDFGDMTVNTTDRTPPPHLYPVPGTFTVRLKVVDSSTCNIADSMQMTITVNGKPTAAFSYLPLPSLVNTPTVFYNNSTGGVVSSTWLFGDGHSTTKNSLDTVIHQYIRTDTFQACLVAVNQFGCPDTACHPVPAIVHPLLDVPNAFTPGRFGQNGIVKVVGFGIVKMAFRIYNRWGQKVFESNDPYIGWDGMFKGNLQPMDVYAYTLEAEYFDGTRATKKGDITLIR